jgi:hypothetical protein
MFQGRERNGGAKPPHARADGDPIYAVIRSGAVNQTAAPAA